MTAGPTDRTDAALLRDIATVAAPWQRPEPPPSARYTIVGDSLRVETGDGGVTEVVLYDIPTLLGQDNDPGRRAWIDTVLDRVPEAYGDQDQPERIIDLWLNDLVNLHDAAGYWRFQYRLAERGMSEAGTFDAAESSLAEAFDRIRTDEEENDGSE